MESIPQLYRNRLEGVANLTYTIVLPVVMQMNEFIGKSQKLKKTKLWTTTEFKKK